MNDRLGFGALRHQEFRASVAHVRSFLEFLPAVLLMRQVGATDSTPIGLEGKHDAIG